MRLFFLVMFLGSGSMASGKLIVEISSSTNDEINKTLEFARPPETTSVFNRKKQFFKLGANDVTCDVSFFDSKASIGCEQTKDNKDRVIAESGFQVATVADCSTGDQESLSFSNKTKKGGYWVSFKILIKCVQEKI